MIDFDSASIGYDTTFELNEFGQPKLRSEIEVVKNTILYVLFSKPGQYPSLPQIGMDIESMLYSFYDEIDEDTLVNKLTDQCEALGTYFDSGAIAIKKQWYKNKPALLIHIEGTESYPDGYLNDSNTNADKYLIGITLNDLNQMIYNINASKGES
jgi:hypothetical protein